MKADGQPLSFFRTALMSSGLFFQLLGAFFFLVGLTFPQIANAHGELELRIAAATRQIQTATNHLATLYLHRGELHREHKDWDAAKADYDRAAQLDPALAAVDLARALLLSDAGEWGAARVLFDQVLSRSPTQGEAFMGRARVLVKLGQRPAALADFQRGMELLSAPEPEHFLEWAQILNAEGQADEAVRRLDQGIKKLGPVETLQRYALEIELERQRTEAALARLDAMIEHAPRKESWLARKGEILLAAGRAGEAKKSFRAALVAMDALPRLLRQGPPMQQLQARVRAGLAAIHSQKREESVRP